MNQADKQNAIEMLAVGKSLKEIADQLEISYSSLVMFNAEYEEAKALNNVPAFLGLNAEVAELTSHAKVVAKPTVLDVHDALVNTALALNLKLNTLVLSADSVGDVSCAASILVELNDSFSALLIKSGGAPLAQGETADDSKDTDAVSTYLADAPGELE